VLLIPGSSSEVSDWAAPARAVSYRPSRLLARWVMTTSAIMAALMVVGAGTAWWVAVAPRSTRVDIINPDTWRAADWADVGVSSLNGLIQLLAGILAIVWLWRVRGNAEEASAVQHRRARVWVWLGWLVPVVHLWFPYQVVADVYRASDPDAPPQSPSITRPAPSWLLVWWLAFLLPEVLAFVVTWATDAPVHDQARIDAVVGTITRC